MVSSGSRVDNDGVCSIRHVLYRYVKSGIILYSTVKVEQPFQSGGQMRLSRAARGPELQTKTQNEDAYITIPLLQIRQISEMAGAACHGEGYQCPARWMSLTGAECHSEEL